MRYFLDVSYCGTPYHGWQIQKNAISVQEVLNKALSTLLKSEISCTGSGRTDAGVHASQQIAHFDTGPSLDLNDFHFKMNSILPGSISINRITEVKEEAHARFDATKRSYEYLIHREKDPFKVGRSYLFNQPLNQEKIKQSLTVLKQWTNFKAFSKVKTDVNNYDCEIFNVSWETSDTDHRFCVSANRFLRGMVRAMVGTLLEIGQERISIDELKQILESGDRSSAGRSVPPEGLYLCAVEYPSHISI